MKCYYVLIVFVYYFYMYMMIYIIYYLIYLENEKKNKMWWCDVDEKK